MKKSLIFFLLLGTGGFIVSQKIQFKILNEETKNAVSNAQIYSGKTLLTQTDSAGIFTVENDALVKKFRITAPGFEDKLLVLLQDKGGSIYLRPAAGNIAEVIIKSTLLPRALQEIPGAVNLITSADFKRNDAVNILESFKNVPGIYINQGALNTNKINIRGIGSRSQYSTDRIQAFIDGIPLTTGEGELTLDDFDTETLDRVEIIKGPTSSIFGAGLGGAIQLYTRENFGKKTEAKISSQWGSFNTNKQVLQALISSEKFGISATLNEVNSDGFRENSTYRRQSALLNGSIKSSEGGKLSFVANFTRLKAFIPSSVNENTFLNTPEKADVSWAQSEGYESYDRGLFGISYHQSFSAKLENITSVFGSFRNGYEPRPFDILEDQRISTGIRTQFNYKNKILTLPSNFSFGGQFYTEWYSTANFSNLYKQFPGQGSVQGAQLTENRERRTYANAFAQISLKVSEKLSVETGLNFNTTAYTLTDLFENNSLDQSGKYNFKPVLSARFGSSYELSKGKNAYASVSQGFSIPGVAETLTPEGQINTDLKPEKGINYEIGFKGNWLQNKLYTEISAYSIQIENLLVAERVAEDQYVGLNAGKTAHEGVEMLVNYRYNVNGTISLKPYLSAAFNSFKFKNFQNNDQEFSGNKIPGVPAYTFNAGSDLAIGENFQLSGNFRSVGKIALNDGNSAYAGAYQLVNFKASYTLKVISKVDFNFYGGVNNLFNEHYAASILTNAVAFGGKQPRYYYPGMPRNYFGGVQVSYLF